MSKEYDNARPVKIIGPVNTNTDNPWRTLGEYREEQAQMRKAHRWAVAASIAAIFTSVFTCVLAYTAIVEISKISTQAQAQKQQSTQSK